MEFLQHIFPTILVALTGVFTWFLKDKSEKLKLQKEKLVEEKRLNYQNILEPIIKTFSGAKNPSDLKSAQAELKSF